MNWLRFLNERQPFTYLIGLLLVAASAMLGFMIVSQDFWNVPFALLEQGFQSSWIAVLVNTVAVLLIGIILNRMVNEHAFFSKSSLATGLFLLPIATIFGMEARFSPALWATLFLYLGWSKFARIYKQKRVLRECFETGFWTGMAIILTPYLLIVPIFYLLALGRLRSFNWRESILILFGSALPLIYVLGLGYFFEGKTLPFLTLLSDQINFHGRWPLLILGLLVIVLLYTAAPLLYKSNQGGRRIGGMIGNLFLLQLPLLLVASYYTLLGNYEAWVLLAPWFGLCMSIWAQNGKSGFFARLFFFYYLAICVLGFSLKAGWINI